MKDIYVALITPFYENGCIDYKTLKMILLNLINEGCEGFVVCGTTGEASTLSEQEKFNLLEFVIEVCDGKASIVFGCGSNDTMETLRMCKKAESYLIDGLLLVTPYYNKPTQEGLYQHYEYIASRCQLPIILYEVESRCGCGFEIETLKRLTQNNSTIVGLKYASDNLSKLKLIKQSVPELKLYCGIDEKIKEFYEIGVDAIISVIGHIAMDKLYLFYKYNDLDVDDYFKNLSKVLFLESNPIGIKYLLSLKYDFSNTLRLPMTSASFDTQKHITTFLTKSDNL